MKQIVTFLLCALLLASCATCPPAAPAPTAAPTAPQLQTFLVYYGDDNAEKILCKEAQAPAVNESVLMEHLVSAGVLREGCAVNSLRMEDTRLIVDFNQAFADLVCSMGTSGEHIIIGSTVNTFLKAYGAASLTFTVNGEVLESGHVIYDFPLEFTP